MSLFSTAVILFLAMNSIGHIDAFVAILERLNPLEQGRIIIRESFFASVIACIFYIGGPYFLHLIQITQIPVQLAGGIILFLKAIKMIFPQIYQSEDIGAFSGTPFIVPLATPLLVGPGALALIIVYACQTTEIFSDVLLALILALATSIAVLCIAPFFKNKLGERGINACQRLTGLLLLLISIQIMLSSLRLFLPTLHF